jgi:hypothetical protein
MSLTVNPDPFDCAQGHGEEDRTMSKPRPVGGVSNGLTPSGYKLGEKSQKQTLTHFSSTKAKYQSLTRILPENLSRQDAKHAKKDYYLFLRTLAPFAPLRETRFSNPFFIRTFQISLAST